MSDKGERGDVMGGPKVWTETEIRDALEELRQAATMAYGELAGTMMHRKGHLRIAALSEPSRKAYCIRENREYIPPPPDPN